ncbi:hypothetical protein E4T38_09167 [Aureobasidium subglaciale]|nr:hypothetical protein E4T38_09167 [Aureobasidium subglaciale]KAI5214395.1 hypothetical protein E4T40_09045 [Aureobasidium subglaciale]KAI5216967.1 hypothetical protein E4T41_09047 [Aureobasidium subglaciale]KAI5253225.1 hypothetical protein E4T46_09665 [Aureobasidium subglaciale]
MDENIINNIHAIATHDWAKRFLCEYGNAGVERLASSYRDGQHCTWQSKHNGSFNSCHKVLFEDGTAWAVRYPIPGRVMHSDEKIRREAAVMMSVKKRTQIPVPKVIALGAAADNHDPLIGPFLITEWVEGKPLAIVLEELPRPSWGPVLRQDVEEDQLRKVYGQMARILLELAAHDFDEIGALVMTEGESESDRWSIVARPMTLKVNEIEAGGNVIADDHDLPAFKSTTEYMQNLVQQNITHLHEQGNSIDDASDARQKFVLRCRMMELIPHFVSRKYDSGPFKLVCDDFRFGNVLVDETSLQVTGIIDWEWTYTAPYQSLFCPPPWLILERPTSWTKNGEERCKQKLSVFLQCLEEEEKRLIRSAYDDPPDRCMSSLMRDSFEDGTFRFMQLLQEAFNFDEEILWRNLEKALRRRGLLEVGVPSKKEVESFVRAKVAQLDQYNQRLQAKESNDGQEVQV